MRAKHLGRPDPDLYPVIHVLDPLMPMPAQRRCQQRQLANQHPVLQRLVATLVLLAALHLPHPVPLHPPCLLQ